MATFSEDSDPDAARHGSLQSVIRHASIGWRTHEAWRRKLAVRPWSFETTVAVAIAAAIAIRLVCAALIPPATDELLYWRYSKHLAPGFLDHPALNPLLIRMGTTLFGDTPLGIRFFAVGLGIPTTWAVWRAAEAFFASPRAGAAAALLLNATLVLSVGSLFATSDAAVVATSALLLYALAQLVRTNRAIWWLAAGAAFGLGMWAKYTTFFFAFGIAAWLLLVPKQRQWLLKPEPYLAALTALLVFTPVLIWNAEHRWASAVYQSSRMVVHRWSGRYLLEFAASQIGLATPSVAILAGVGLRRGSPQDPGRAGVLTLLLALVAPVLLYFAWHSLHERVQANWPECIFPALACAGAAAVTSMEQRRAPTPWVTWSYRLAAPLGALIAALVYAHAILGLLPAKARDPFARVLGYGWPTLAAQIDAARTTANAPLVLTSDYSLTGELSYYLPSRAPVEQISERVRWINEPAPDASLLSQPLLYVCKNGCRHVAQLSARFAHVNFLATLPRQRNGRTIETYSLYRVSDPIAPVFDPLYPIRIKGSDDDSL